jgi:protease-4
MALYLKILRAAVSAAALLSVSSCMLIGDEQVGAKFGSSKIGVVEVSGTIMDSKEVIKRLDEFKEDQSVKAIVLRVESPGGAVGAIQEIYREVMKLREGKDARKVVASMGNTAASGGYYVSAAANRIFANPGTVTGSIGVISHQADFGELMDLLKIHFSSIKSGKFKDTGTPFRPLTPEEHQLMQELVLEMHQQFVSDIAKGRARQVSEIALVADGRVMTGARAKDLGLVDELGNLQDAIDWAAKAAGIAGKPSVVYGRKKRPAFLREMFESILGDLDEMGSRSAGLKLMYE